VPLIEMPSNSSLGQRGMTKLQPHTHACSSLQLVYTFRDGFDFGQWVCFGIMRSTPPHWGKPIKQRKPKQSKQNKWEREKKKQREQNEMSGSAIKIKPA